MYPVVPDTPWRTASLPQSQASSRSVREAKCMALRWVSPCIIQRVLKPRFVLDDLFQHLGHAAELGVSETVLGQGAAVLGHIFTVVPAHTLAGGDKTAAEFLVHGTHILDELLPGEAHFRHIDQVRGILLGSGGPEQRRRLIQPAFRPIVSSTAQVSKVYRLSVSRPASMALAAINLATLP